MTPNPHSAREVLRDIAARGDECFDLAETALTLASLRHPGLSLDPYRAHLKELTHDVAAESASMPPAATDEAEALADVLGNPARLPRRR